MENSYKKPNSTTEQIETPPLDRISSLPNHILHKILCFLPKGGSAAARTSTLSKRWEVVWRSFPMIYLLEESLLDDDQEPFPEDYIVHRRNQFIEWVELSMVRRTMDHIKELQITTVFPGTNGLYLLVDIFVDRAVRGGLRTLILRFPNYDISCFKLPEAIYSFGSIFLVTVVVEGCSFQSFNGVVNFGQLKTLSLVNVNIAEHLLHTLINGCPVITSLTLKLCHGVKFVCICHSKIRVLILKSGGEIQGFKIDIPSLSSFTFKGPYLDDFEFNSSSAIEFCFLETLMLSRTSMTAEKLHQAVSKFPTLETINLKACSIIQGRFQVSGKCLKNVTVTDCDLEDQVMDFSKAEALQVLRYVDRYYFSRFSKVGLNFLQHLTIIGDTIKISDRSLTFTVENCHLLESLNLESCTGLKKVGFTSRSLKSLVVYQCHDLEKIWTIARNMLFFKYVGPCLKFMEVITSFELNAELHLKECRHNHNNFDLLEMKEILQKFSLFAKTLTLVSDCHRCMIIKDASECPVEYPTELNVKTKLGTTGLVQLLCGLLRISLCHKILSIELESKDWIELKFQELSLAEIHELHNQMFTHDCVRDHLVEVRMNNFEGEEEEMRLVEFLLNKAAHLQTMSINMKKKTFLANPVRLSEVITWKNNLSEVFVRSEILLSSESG